ncbi:MAG TPA: glycosyltransferase family 4 protein, partial [Terriglobales bacterium]|nr:glycosyltransferase family 4 protein [Terriglobales bacterium]
PEALGSRIEWLATHVNLARAMGARSRERVESISWNSAVKKLLGAPQPSGRRQSGSPPGKLTVAATFGVTPALGGGQMRILQLYKNFFPLVTTELITLGSYGEEGFSRDICPGLREIRIPKSKAHHDAEQEISAEVEWFPVTDVAFAELAHLTPQFGQQLESSCSSSDTVVASHPFVFPLIEDVTDKPVWYEAQDVEYALKKEVIPKTAQGVKLIEGVRNVESRCCQKAAIVLGCSDDDGKQLASLYDFDLNKLRVVPNGVDSRKTRFVTRHESQQMKELLGLQDSFLAIFIGSWHEPNLRAVETVLALAEKDPKATFLILGSSCLAFEKIRKPPNVGLLGVLDEAAKHIVLSAADVALNPMLGGSGTNLKMLEYAAAGIPIVSTPHGMRGLTYISGSEIFVANIGNFSKEIARVRGMPRPSLQALTLRARQRTEDDFDWRRISSNFLASL